MNEIVLGTVSEATLRKEDLIPSFTQELLRIDAENEVGNRVWAAYSEYEGDDPDEDPYFKSEESDWDMDALFDELNNVCNIPFVYFGASEGDGADFGFWVQYSEVEDAIKYEEIKSFKDEDELVGFSGQAVLETKSGEYSLYEVEDGVLKSMIW